MDGLPDYPIGLDGLPDDPTLGCVLYLTTPLTSAPPPQEATSRDTTHSAASSAASEASDAPAPPQVAAPTPPASADVENKLKEVRTGLLQHCSEFSSDGYQRRKDSAVECVMVICTLINTAAEGLDGCFLSVKCLPW